MQVISGRRSDNVRTCLGELHASPCSERVCGRPVMNFGEHCVFLSGYTGVLMKRPSSIALCRSTSAPHGSTGSPGLDGGLVTSPAVVNVSVTSRAMLQCIMTGEGTRRSVLLIPHPHDQTGPTLAFWNPLPETVSSTETARATIRPFLASAEFSAKGDHTIFDAHGGQF